MQSSGSVDFWTPLSESSEAKYGVFFSGRGGEKKKRKKRHKCKTWNALPLLMFIAQNKHKEKKKKKSRVHRW